jgi:hypothetical protein
MLKVSVTYVNQSDILDGCDVLDELWSDIDHGVHSRGWNELNLLPLKKYMEYFLSTVKTEVEEAGSAEELTIVKKRIEELDDSIWLNIET